MDYPSGSLGGVHRHFGVSESTETVSFLSAVLWTVCVGHTVVAFMTLTAVFLSAILWSLSVKYCSVLLESEESKLT